jgi:Uma2 family endonuclease
MSDAAYEELTVVPRIAVTLPLPLPLPAGFDPVRPEAWPTVSGRLEYVQGRLLFMPPCGDHQQQTAIDTATELNLWRRAHPEFVVGGNEAGMLLGGEVRAADIAVWRRADLGTATGGFPRVPPLLAVEIAGKDEQPDTLVEKARWYLAHGVQVVWVLVPTTRSAIVLRADARVEVGAGQTMPSHPALPGLGPMVDDLFRQVAATF